MLVVIMFIPCVAKAQFYDSADDIYYYMLVDKQGEYYYSFVGGQVYVFNFDGRKAAALARSSSLSVVKNDINHDAEYYEKLVEKTEYDVHFKNSNALPPTYFWSNTFGNRTYVFSNDRKYLTETTDFVIGGMRTTQTLKYKRVDKSFFKLGRSRTPSGTLYE